MGLVSSCYVHFIPSGIAGNLETILGRGINIPLPKLLSWLINNKKVPDNI